MTWTIEMSSKELARKTEVERAIDHRITQREAAHKLGISERQFRRILKRYRQEGDGGLVSSKRGKPSNRRTDIEIVDKVRDFIKQPIMEGFGPTMMAEKLESKKGICLSKETVRRMMIRAGVWEAKTKKKSETHPARPRRMSRGELVQIDGSKHAWLEERGPKATLLVFVDDATSAVLAAEFVEQESFFTYGALCKSYFRAMGTPVAFYSDKFSVFRVNAGNNKDAITQFSRALNTLGIELICANSPQAKGRVERANQTFQDRLVKEMRILHINNYQAANAFLPAFIQSYNRKFAVLPRSTDDAHAPLDKDCDLDFLFSIHGYRIISKDLLIRYENVTYQIVTTRPPQYLAGREVLVVQHPSGSISAYLNRLPLTLKVYNKLPAQARIVSTKSSAPYSVVPPIDHPWRSYGKKLNGKPVLFSDQ